MYSHPFTHIFAYSEDGTFSAIWFGWDSIFSSVVLFIICQLLLNVRRFPIALIAFLYGLIVAFATNPWIVDKMSLGISLPAPIVPSQVSVIDASYRV